MANKKITRQLSIFINGKEVKNSLGGIGREISKIKAKLKEANDPKDIQKYKKELDQFGEKYGEVKQEISGTNKVLEEAKGHFDNLLTGFLSGNLKQAASGLKGIAGNLKGITKAALAFIATPIGAALAVLTTVAVGVKEWVGYNLEIEKTNQLIRDLTQETGNAVDGIRIRAELLKETFDVDLNKTVETAKSLVKSYGITYNEAFDIIEDGALRGKLKNDEFLDSLKEYPIQFKNAGFSATDFANIVNTGIDLSIYSDKLPDAIKEFNLSISEQTDAAKEALTNAFGEKFTTKLLKKLRTGATTAKEALALISAEAKTIGLNSQQAQLLTADLFKGAGEDAGGALKIFEAVNIALNQQKKPLTELQQIQKDQLNTSKELKSVYTQLFASGSKGFNLWIQKGKLFVTQTLLEILKSGVAVYNWFVDLNNESRFFSGLLKLIGVNFATSFKVIGALISLAKNQFGSLGDVIEGVFTLDLDKIKKGFSSGLSNIGDSISKLKAQSIKDAAAIKDAFNGNNKLERKTLDSFLSDVPSANPVPPKSTSNSGSNSELTAEDKRIIDSKKKLEEFLDAFDEEQHIKKQLEGLEADEAAQLKEELELEAKYAKLEADALGEKELLKRLETAKQSELDAITKKWDDKAAKDDKTKKDKQSKADALHHKQQVAARKALNKQILNSAINLAGEESKIGQSIIAFKRLMAAKETLIQLGLLKNKVTANAASATSDVAAGTAQTAKIGFPQNIPLLIGFAAQAVGVFSAIKSATKATKVISAPTFFEGGPTGDKALYNDKYGKVTGELFMIMNGWPLNG